MDIPSRELCYTPLPARYVPWLCSATMPGRNFRVGRPREGDRSSWGATQPPTAERHQRGSCGHQGRQRALGRLGTRCLMPCGGSERFSSHDYTRCTSTTFLRPLPGFTSDGSSGWLRSKSHSAAISGADARRLSDGRITRGSRTQLNNFGVCFSARPRLSGFRVLVHTGLPVVRAWLALRMAAKATPWIDAPKGTTTSLSVRTGNASLMRNTAPQPAASSDRVTARGPGSPSGESCDSGSCRIQ